jgi:hypothetical protein
LDKHVNQKTGFVETDHSQDHICNRIVTIGLQVDFLQQCNHVDQRQWVKQFDVWNQAPVHKSLMDSVMVQVDQQIIRHIHMYHVQLIVLDIGVVMDHAQLLVGQEQNQEHLLELLQHNMDEQVVQVSMEWKMVELIVRRVMNELV